MIFFTCSAMFLLILFSKVIQDLTGKCKKFEDQLASLNSFYSERRNYQNKIKDLEDVIEQMNKKLGSSTATTKEREASIGNQIRKNSIQQVDFL